MTYDEMIAQAYPWLAAMQPTPAARIFGTAAGFLAMQALVRGNEPPTAIQEIAEYEAYLYRLRAVLPPAVTLEDLGATLGRLHRDYRAAPALAVVEWLYREIAAGKDWAAVRDSDPRHPAPLPDWSARDFAAGATARPNTRAQKRHRRRAERG